MRRDSAAEASASFFKRIGFRLRFMSLSVYRTRSQGAKVLPDAAKRRPQREGFSAFLSVLLLQSSAAMTLTAAPGRSVCSEHRLTFPLHFRSSTKRSFGPLTGLPDAANRRPQPGGLAVSPAFSSLTELSSTSIARSSWVDFSSSLLRTIGVILRFTSSLETKCVVKSLRAGRRYVKLPDVRTT